MAFKRQEEWDWLIELHTLVGSFKGCEVDFHQSRLHDLISEAIKRRVPEIMGCFSREGVTEKMLADLERIADNSDLVAQYGIDWSTRQCRELLAAKVDGLHFYTLNRADLVYAICRVLGVREPVAGVAA